MAMHRTHVFLEPEQHAALHRQARQEGRTISEIVREYVDLGLARRRADFHRSICLRLDRTGPMPQVAPRPAP